MREALSIYDKQPDTWQRYFAQSSLGGCLEGQRRFAEAEPLLLAGYQGLVQHESTIQEGSLSAIPKAGDRIVQLYRDWGKPAQAAEWRAKLARH